MGTLAEFLAGCPRPSEGGPATVPWGSCRAFPGFMIRRMYILLTRPKQAVGEFGADDYKTPFLFFLFFEIIFTLSGEIASDLQFAVFLTSGHSSNIQTGLKDVPGIFYQMIALDPLVGTVEWTLYHCLLLGISVLILALIVWQMSGVRSWNPAFTISAYCLPVLSLLSTLAAVLRIPGVFPDFLSGGLSTACTIIGLILMTVIAGYGISKLQKIPVTIAVAAAVCWSVIWVLITALAGNYVINLVIIPAGDGIRDMISRTFFPPASQSFPTAAALGKNP
jgi:hypothetical protein